MGKSQLREALSSNPFIRADLPLPCLCDGSHEIVEHLLEFESMGVLSNITFPSHVFVLRQESP